MKEWTEQNDFWFVGTLLVAVVLVSAALLIGTLLVADGFLTLPDLLAK
jgi:hypothetical protein